MTYFIFFIISTLACIMAGLIKYTNDDNWRDLPIGTKRQPETINKFAIIFVIWCILEISGAVIFL